MEKELLKCAMCNFIIDKEKNIIKDTNIQNKYKGSKLTQSYCKECYKLILEENNFK